jgi:hypothetical protein
MSDGKKPVVVLDSSDTEAFEDDCNALVRDGYVMSSSSCGHVDSAEYDFCATFQAVFVLKEQG